jgi:putative acetyltransferase
METIIREIQKEDDPFIAAVIRSVLEEHGVNRPGTAYFDKSLQHMSDFYRVKNGTYLICLADGKIAGGAGVYPTEGLPPGTCELVKMYLLRGARGKGLGKALIKKCMDFARQKGYTGMYLETMPELQAAVRVYQQLGFTLLPHALGNTGHFACTIRMIREIG